MGFQPVQTCNADLKCVGMVLVIDNTNIVAIVAFPIALGYRTMNQEFKCFGINPNAVKIQGPNPKAHDIPAEAQSSVRVVMECILWP